ncbi:signal peptidase I [Streptomyces caniscabiei]|uniref:signal peptidase I n=1 Tax=Streptomyces caniscabiei TaxID=2746961 RepID=UPI0029AECAAE|nr:signal peptidase I [Streptomyces caniscabiei]MDX2776233.1 signal peptidase I [Streptomyces caniscabiei]
MEASFLQRHPYVKDALSIIVFVICVLVGTLVINTYVFRSFNVLGPSMETTFYTGDRLIVNRLPVTWAMLQNKEYIPERGEIIVFKNPQFNISTGDEYIVKRVIAFPGERVTVHDGVLTVYNDEHPDGFQPDKGWHGPGSPTSGEVDTTVSDGTLFVAGDHRQGNFSYDSRSGLGLIPFYDVVGPVGLRIYPFNKIQTY